MSVSTNKNFQYSFFREHEQQFYLEYDPIPKIKKQGILKFNGFERSRIQLPSFCNEWHKKI